MKSDYNYSAGIVYNNFPFPVGVKPAAKKRIEDAAQAVLEARILIEKRCESDSEKCSLATMYSAKTPEKLVNAHNELDKAVDAAYAYGRNKKDDASRVAFCLENIRNWLRRWWKLRIPRKLCKNAPLKIKF